LIECFTDKKTKGEKLLRRFSRLLIDKIVEDLSRVDWQHQGAQMSTTHGNCQTLNNHSSIVGLSEIAKHCQKGT